MCKKQCKNKTGLTLHHKWCQQNIERCVICEDIIIKDDLSGLEFSECGKYIHWTCHKLNKMYTYCHDMYDCFYLRIDLYIGRHFLMTSG